MSSYAHRNSCSVYPEALGSTVLYCSAGALYSVWAQLQRRVGPETYGNIVVWKADEVFVRVGHEMRALLLEELLEVETRALELIGAQLRTHTVHMKHNMYSNSYSHSYPFVRLCIFVQIQYNMYSASEAQRRRTLHILEADGEEKQTAAEPIKLSYIIVFEKRMHK